MSDTIQEAPGNAIIDQIHSPLFPHLKVHIEELPNTTLSIDNTQVVSNLNSLLSPLIEKCKLYSLDDYDNDYGLPAAEKDELRARHANNNHEPAKPILVVEAYVIIPEGERVQDLSVNWQNASGLDMEGYFFYYQQNGGRPLQETNKISKIIIARFVEPHDSFALIKFFLWNKNPTTSRGTVTTVQTQG